MNRRRHFLSLADYSRDELLAMLNRAIEMKKRIPGKGPKAPLEGRCIGLIFEKPSTRTRVSFEVGICQLGGRPIFLSGQELQLSRGEPLRDSARVLSRYLHGVVVRTFGHEILEELAEWSSIPVINGLTDLLHPCQVLADLMTLKEVGIDITRMHAAWVGDGNNMANSWIHAAKLLGFRLDLACPEGYDPAIPIDGARISLTRDPKQAVKEADVVSTDVWASMGQETEAEQRRKAFQGFQVNSELLGACGNRTYVLHCLPAHRGEEITDDVMESDQSLVWDQAENRLHAQKAVLELLVRE